jgi:hypothetical protein
MAEEDEETARLLLDEQDEDERGETVGLLFEQEETRWESHKAPQVTLRSAPLTIVSSFPCPMQ